MTAPTIAVLGAGIMGCSTSLFLARRGASVVLIDQRSEPMTAASRWNEGKVHLGFLYSGDPSLVTARRILPGGLAFGPLMTELIDSDPSPACSPGDDTYLCHADSVVAPQAMADYFESVATLVTDHPGAREYLTDVSACRVQRLTAPELAALTDNPTLVAGFRVPERSVATGWLADRVAGAVQCQAGIELALESRVSRVDAHQGAAGGRFTVVTSTGPIGPVDFVVNCLWEGRIAVDQTHDLMPPAIRSHRYRVSLFLRTRGPSTIPSAVIATGPFGDVKNYNGRDLYLSWYPSGLLEDSRQVRPPSPPELDLDRRAAISANILAEMGDYLQAVRRLPDELESCILEGGWVYAAGEGSLADAGASLHHRADVGIRRRGNYVSVDTGKYSIAPWLARQVADLIVPR